MLTGKQKKFCDEYLIDLNATQAAIRAGYSEKTSSQIGEQNLRKLEIQKYIASRQQKLSEKVQITQEMVLNELAKVGFSNMQDYFDGNLNAKDLAKLPSDKARAVSSIKKTVITFDGGEKETIEFKLYDKVKSLELIGRHLGFFENDNKQVAPVVNMPDLSKLDYDELKGLLRSDPPIGPA